jgi:hypothetical protein
MMYKVISCSCCVAVKSIPNSLYYQHIAVLQRCTKYSPVYYACARCRRAKQKVDELSVQETKNECCLAK